MEDESIQKAIDAIKEVMNVHENHFFPRDKEALDDALKILELMKKDGFN
jgi:hypothetical protein